MAKSILRKLLLLSCCFSAILFLSCEKEFLEEEYSNSKSNIIKTKVNFDDFKKNQKAFDVFNNLNLSHYKSTNKNSDVQNSNSYDFEINFNNGTHLSYHNLESYTFPIRRDVYNGLLENILISEHTDGKYYAKLLKYNLTSQERIDLENGELKSMQNPIVTEVLGEYKFVNKIQSDCGYITITITTACVNGHTSASQCNLTGSAAPQIKSITVAIDCNDGSSGGGGTGDGSGGYYGDPFYGGGGSDGGGYITPSFPNDTTPTGLYEDGISEAVLDIGDGTVYQDKNITKLNISTNNIVIKPKMTDLKNRVTDTKEHGYEFTTNTNGSLVSSNLLVGGLDGVQFPPMQVNTKVRVHVHHNELEPIPSIQDVVGFASMYKDKVNLNATDANEIISIIMSQNVNYALRVSDPVKLQAFLNVYNDSNLTNEKGQTYKDVVDKLFSDITLKANKSCAGTCSDEQYDALLEYYFIKAFKQLNCGISLYFAVPPTSSNPNYTWTQIN